MNNSKDGGLLKTSRLTQGTYGIELTPTDRDVKSPTKTEDTKRHDKP